MADLFEEKRISPMLLYESEPFDDSNYVFELKLDGIRCIAYIDKEGVVLQNKRFKDVSDIYPELKMMNLCIKSRCILDGELVLLKDGKPDFFGLQRRSLMSDKMRIERSAKKNPVQFVAYDILYLGTKDLTFLPLLERKRLLKGNVTEKNNLSISRFIEKEGKKYFELVKQQGLEGIVAKKKDGKYIIGKRSHEWVKIKVMRDEDLLVCGYEKDENGDVKDLIMGYYDNGRLLCRGKVFLGVSKEERRIISDFARTNTVSTPHFDKYADAVWLKPELVGAVHFMHETENGSMRQPVWKGLRDDKI